ncbi:MAG: hypothetical protein H6510_02325 [Acidobacteria bacterium]|nr:hypothetical protein [Acidobacteriota bacterium]
MVATPIDLAATEAKSAETFLRDTSFIAANGQTIYLASRTGPVIGLEPDGRLVFLWNQTGYGPGERAEVIQGIEAEGNQLVIVEKGRVHQFKNHQFDQTRRWGLKGLPKGLVQVRPIIDGQTIWIPQFNGQLAEPVFFDKPDDLLDHPTWPLPVLPEPVNSDHPYRHLFLLAGTPDHLFGLNLNQPLLLNCNASRSCQIQTFNHTLIQQLMERTGQFRIDPDGSWVQTAYLFKDFRARSGLLFALTVRGLFVLNETGNLLRVLTFENEAGEELVFHSFSFFDNQNIVLTNAWFPDSEDPHLAYWVNLPNDLGTLGGTKK